MRIAYVGPGFRVGAHFKEELHNINVATPNSLDECCSANLVEKINNFDRKKILKNQMAFKLTQLNNIGTTSTTRFIRHVILKKFKKLQHISQKGDTREAYDVMFDTYFVRGLYVYACF